MLTVEIWFGLFYLRLKFGLVFFAYGGKSVWSFLLTVPLVQTIGFDLFYLRFPYCKQKRRTVSKKTSTVSKKDASHVKQNASKWGAISDSETKAEAGAAPEPRTRKPGPSAHVSTKIARFSAVAAAIFTAPGKIARLSEASRCAISSAKKIASEPRFFLR